MKLHWGSGSGPAWRVMLALAVKNVPYESKLLSFSKGETRTDAFKALNPRGKVPVLEDGAFVLNESIAILAYLDGKYPEPPLFGRTPEQTGLVWRAIFEHENHMSPALSRVTRPLLFGQLAEKEREVRDALPAMHDELAALQARLGQHPWLVGDAISAADLVVYPTLATLKRAAGKPGAAALELGVEPLGDRYPALAAWTKRIEALPGYDATYPPHWREG